MAAPTPLAGPSCSSRSSMDQGPRSWHIDEAGGKVDKTRLTQRHRALQHVGIRSFPPIRREARGRSERAFRTLLDRLPNELALRRDHGEGGGQPQPGRAVSPHLQSTLWVPTPEAGPAFVPWIGITSPRSYVCMRSRSWPRITPCMITSSAYRSRRTPIGSMTRRALVRVHAYPNGTLAVFYGPRCLARSKAKGHRLGQPRP